LGTLHPSSYVVACSAVAIIIEVVARRSVPIVVIVVVRGAVATITPGVTSLLLLALS